MDSMDIHLSEGGLTTADKVHKREEFRLLIADVQDLPETQRTALLLREIDALSYDQIAEAMETTVPSVKSLLVRARVSLAEAAEARLLSCDEVRLELGEVAEGLTRTSAPVRRHLRTCDRCTAFRKQLRSTNKALAALYPVGPLILLKKLLITHIGTSAAAGSAAAAGGAAASSAGAGAALQVGFTAFASKAAAGLAAAAIVTAGAVEVQHAAKPRAERNAAVAQLRPADKAAAPAPTAVADAGAGPEHLRPAADRAERAQGQADQGHRAQDRLGEGQGQGHADPDGHRHGRERDPDHDLDRPRPRPRAATRPRCRPTRSAPPSPAAAPTRRRRRPRPPPARCSPRVQPSEPTPEPVRDPVGHAGAERDADRAAGPDRRRRSRSRRAAADARRRAPTATADARVDARRATTRRPPATT